MGSKFFKVSYIILLIVFLAACASKVRFYEDAKIEKLEQEKVINHMSKFAYRETRYDREELDLYFKKLHSRLAQVNYPLSEQITSFRDAMSEKRTSVMSKRAAKEKRNRELEAQFYQRHGVAVDKREIAAATTNPSKESAAKFKHVSFDHDDWDEKTKRAVANGWLFIGMTEDQVLASWGQPVSKLKVPSGDSVTEEWQYSEDDVLLIVDAKLAAIKDPGAE